MMRMSKKQAQRILGGICGFIYGLLLIAYGDITLHASLAVIFTFFVMFSVVFGLALLHDLICIAVTDGTTFLMHRSEQENQHKTVQPKDSE